ncbi:flagellar basal body-associated protein FliL [Vulgatibacter sp.]|uniref:flagellar basal body-associated FliL family protein n=1 Tax=Vulgatibacter sp. TaxID=1971226 RepID=UPI00356A5036
MNKLVPLLLGLNTLLLAGVLATLFLRQGGVGSDVAEKAPQESADAAAQAPVAPALGPIVRLPDFVVHLRNPEVDRYARLTLELELAGEKERETVTTYMPKLRDALLAWLADRTLEEMRGSEGMERMKEAMLRELETVLPGRPVRAVYIADFVVQ